MTPDLSYVYGGRRKKKSANVVEGMSNGKKKRCLILKLYHVEPAGT